ncbi:MAG: FHA domain-containing protein [Lachnospiraceae bacterium]|nr:FHA domain-containing protein [Lachnospiraceae bacterium]
MANPGDLRICKKGHYYNPEKYSECPTCKKNGGETAGSAEMRRVVRGYHVPEDGNEDVTVAEAVKKIGFQPIAGWLVCVDGEGKGKDYKILYGRNFIGRDRSMDICIQGDKTISRVNHASISYDDKAKKYYYSPEIGRSIDYINGNPVFETVELHNRDCIEIGSMKLVFAPLCGDNFRWEDWNEE